MHTRYAKSQRILASFVHKIRPTKKWFTPIGRRAKQLASVISFAILIATGTFSYLSYMDDLERDRRDQKVRVQKLINSAWDIFGGEPGTTWVEFGTWTEDETERIQAGRLARQALTIDPDNARAYMLLGYLHLSFYDIEKSIKNFQKAAELSSNNAMAYNAIAQVLQATGEKDAALHLYKSALNLSSDEQKPGILRNIGLVQRELGKLSDSEVTLRRALNLISTPSSCGLHRELGLTLLEADRLDEAEAQMRQAIKWCPDLEPPHVNLGNILLRKGQYDPAINSFKNALKVNDKYSGTYVGLGQALFLNNKYSESEENLQKALRLNSKSASALFWLGLLSLKDEKYKKAEKYFSNSIHVSQTEIQEGDIELDKAYYNLGISQMRQKKYSEASKSFENSFSMNPKLREAEDGLAGSKRMMEK